MLLVLVFSLISVFNQYLILGIDIRLCWCRTTDCFVFWNSMISNSWFQNYIEQKYRIWNFYHRLIPSDVIDPLELENRPHWENYFDILYAIYHQLEERLFKQLYFRTEASLTSLNELFLGWISSSFEIIGQMTISIFAFYCTSIKISS